MKLFGKGCLGVLAAFGAIVIIVVIVIVAAGNAVHNASKKQAFSVKVSAPAGKHWSGAIGNSTVDGVGPKTIKFKDAAITAADAQKQTVGNWTLTLTLRDGNKTLDTGSTSAQYGVVTVSGSDF